MLVSRQGDHCTFAEFHSRALAMAGGLTELGIGRGSVVSWILPTWVDTVVLAAALSRLGAVQNPIIAIYRDREVGFCTAQARATHLITPKVFNGFDFGAMGERIAADNPALRHLEVEPGAFPSGQATSLPPFSAPAAAETGWICYTSGTSADPKGARHSDATIGSFVAAMGSCMHVTHGDRYALVFPFPHIGGIALMFLTLHTGCTQLLDEVVDPVATIDYLAAERCTHAGTGTAFFNMYLAAQQRHTGPLFPHLKACPAGGAPTSPAVHRRVFEELGARVVSSWGLTEAPVLTSGTLADPPEVLMSTEGKPLPGVDLRVVDTDGALCPQGTPGELRVKAPQVMLGYQNPELDADAFDSDGYFRTGDIGVIDANGNVSITGRLKDVIIRNGENIGAREVEDLLQAMPSITDAAVIGLPDVRTGESVCAVIVSPNGGPSLEDIQASMTASGLRRQALPTRVVVRDILPRNPAGKVLKRQLVDELRVD